MKRSIFSLVLMLLAFCSLSAQDLSKRFVLVGTFESMTALTDSTWRGNVNFYTDQTGNGYLPTDIEVNFLVKDGLGNRYKIIAINSENIVSGNYDFLELGNYVFGPRSVGAVYAPFANSDLMPVPQSNSTGVTPAFLATSQIHNMYVIDSLINVAMNSSGLDAGEVVGVVRDSGFVEVETDPEYALDSADIQLKLDSLLSLSGVSSESVLYVIKDSGYSGQPQKGRIDRPFPDPWTAKSVADDSDLIFVISGYWVVDTLGSGADVEIIADSLNLASFQNAYYYFYPNTGFEISENFGDVIQIPFESNRFVIDGFGDFMNPVGEFFDMSTGSSSTDPFKTVIIRGRSYRGAEVCQVRSNLRLMDISFDYLETTGDFAFYASPNNSASSAGFLVDSCNVSINIGNWNMIGQRAFRVQNVQRSNYTMNVGNLIHKSAGDQSNGLLLSLAGSPLKNSTVSINIENAVLQNSAIRDSLAFSKYADVTDNHGNIIDSTMMMPLLEGAWGSGRPDENSIINISIKNINSDFPVLGSWGTNGTIGPFTLKIDVGQGVFNYNAPFINTTGIAVNADEDSETRLLINCDYCKGESRLLRFGYYLYGLGETNGPGWFRDIQISGKYEVDPGEPIFHSMDFNNATGDGITEKVTFKNVTFLNDSLPQFEMRDSTSATFYAQGFYTDNNNLGDYVTVQSFQSYGGIVTGQECIISSTLWLDSAKTVGVFSGTGTPEGVVVASVGSVFHRTDGGTGTSYYVKESGSGNTGWIAK